MIHSNTLVASLIATLLFFATIPIAKRVSARERDPGLFGLLMAALAAHLVFTEVALWIVNHFYHGVTD